MLSIQQSIQPLLPNDAYKVFLFGSRVTGTNRRFSDIDIGIIGDKPLSGKNYCDIVESLEQSDVPYHMDVVDFACVSDKVKSHALMHAVFI